MPDDRGGAETWSANFAGSSAAGMNAYEDTLVDPMFIPWADYLLDQLQVAPGERFLDVATGPGTVARLAAARLGTTGYVLAADISPAMLAVAQQKEVVASGAPIDYRLSPATPLDAPDSSFDVACCQQGLQFFPDRHGSLVEMRRALRPGGRIGLAVWAEITSCPPFAALRDAVGQILGAEAAARYAGGPWGLHAPQTLADLMSAAGFSGVSVDVVTLPVRFPAGAAQLDQSFAASGLATEVAALDDDTRRALSAAVVDNVRSMTDDNGAVVSHLTSQIMQGTRA